VLLSGPASRIESAAVSACAGPPPVQWGRLPAGCPPLRSIALVAAAAMLVLSASLPVRAALAPEVVEEAAGWLTADGDDEAAVHRHHPGRVHPAVRTPLPALGLDRHSTPVEPGVPRTQIACQGSKRTAAVPLRQ